MKVLIVHAHPEPKSFNAALTELACASLQEAGHEVVVSDLYAMGFEPVSDRRNFTTRQDPDYFKQQSEEQYATEHDTFAADIAAEQAKLDACDVLILQFPLWWFGLPAILKGWVDRVFAMGRVYGMGRWYDQGTFRGKRALLSVTTGGPPSIYAPDGLNGDIHALLRPVTHGMLAFTGFEVLAPQIAWGPAHVGDEGRRAYLDAWRERLLGLADETGTPPPRVADYDESFRRR